jgi:DNA-binding NarL/FixJ family response regulator
MPWIENALMKTVLVISRNGKFRSDCRAVFNQNTYRFATTTQIADDEIDGISDGVDLAIVDTMDDLDQGLTTVSRLKQRHPDIKVVATSSWSTHYYDFRFWHADACITNMSGVRDLPAIASHLLSPVDKSESEHAG